MKCQRITTTHKRNVKLYSYRFSDCLFLLFLIVSTCLSIAKMCGYVKSWLSIFKTSSSQRTHAHTYTFIRVKDVCMAKMKSRSKNRIVLLLLLLSLSSSSSLLPLLLWRCCCHHHHCYSSAYQVSCVCIVQWQLKHIPHLYRYVALRTHSFTSDSYVFFFVFVSGSTQRDRTLENMFRFLCFPWANGARLATWTRRQKKEVWPVCKLRRRQKRTEVVISAFKQCFL